MKPRKPSEEQANREEGEQRSAPTGAVVYQAIFQEGESELQRTTSALMWSGLAAGLSMSFSFIASALIRTYLPDATWTPLVVALGYPVGFVIVILGRQQLFTENTLTVILPLLTRRDGATLRNVLRLWAAVLSANVVGALIMAFVVARVALLPPETSASLHEIARQSQHGAFGVTLVRGIVAGWLIALTVWLLPFAEAGRVWVIGILTYVVGLGRFAHVIAGAVEAAFFVLKGDSTWAEFAIGFFVPALLGNIIGGITLVAVLNHAQVVAGKSSVDL